MKRYFDLAFDIPLDKTFTYRADSAGLATVGKRAMAPLGRGEKAGYIIGEQSNPPVGVPETSIKELRRIIDKEVIFDTPDIELARWMAGYYLCGIGEALAAMIPSGRRENTLENLGSDDLDTGTHTLSLEQEKALRSILEGGEKPPPYYLYGITGSGKTEVFLRAAEEILKQGKSVIYLVPEISLTHQVREMVVRRFGSAATTLHSGMSPSTRLAEWARIRRGEIQVVVGPRSAIFAPLKKLGLIIIDEEHDGSYKSGNTPRYHARQVALKLGTLRGATVVMGSATPSAEAWKLMDEGHIKRLHLSARLSGGAPPKIHMVSLAGTEGCLTEELKHEIRDCAAAGRQTILFLNRRGFTYFYHCPSCGYELRCKHCSVSLTYHKARGRAVCHYCGYSIQAPNACPDCGSLEAGYSGFGTEMIEEEVKRTFPELRILRVDADALKETSTHDAGAVKGLAEALERFRAGELDILLGTQMVAKGLNFPGVRLVGVVLADTGLHLPDFRAAERTFSLIVQVAGRAGRYFPDGRVLVQTLRPKDQSIRKACALDMEGFYQEELAQRKELGFPPYSRLIRFTARSTLAPQADSALQELYQLLLPLLPSDADILGPAECPIGTISGKHRRHLILRGKNMATLHGAARKALQEYNKHRGTRVYLEVDVDPINLL